MKCKNVLALQTALYCNEFRIDVRIRKKTWNFWKCQSIFLMQQCLLVKISLMESKQCNFVDDHHHKHILEILNKALWGNSPLGIYISLNYPSRFNSKLGEKKCWVAIENRELGVCSFYTWFSSWFSLWTSGKWFKLFVSFSASVKLEIC